MIASACGWVQRLDAAVTGEQGADPVEVPADRILARPTGAPQREPDVGECGLDVGEGEVDRARRRRWLPGGEDVVGGEVAVDDEPARCAVADAGQVDGSSSSHDRSGPRAAVAASRSRAKALPEVMAALAWW